MAQVIITLSDTPTGGVSLHTDFKPAVGAPCSPAQSAALGFMAQHKREWGATAPSGATIQTDTAWRISGAYNGGSHE